MTWWYALKSVVQTRLAGDATLVALLANSTSIVQEMGKPEAAGMYPFVYIHFSGVTPLDAFATNISVVELDVQARAGTKQLYSADEADERCDSIIARVLGDWEVQSSHLASYGLDRWNVGALGSTGYTAGAMVRTIGPLVVQDDNVFGLTTSFRVYVSKAAA